MPINQSTNTFGNPRAEDGVSFSNETDIDRKRRIQSQIDALRSAIPSGFGESTATGDPYGESATASAPFGTGASNVAEPVVQPAIPPGPSIDWSKTEQDNPAMWSTGQIMGPVGPDAEPNAQIMGPPAPPSYAPVPSMFDTPANAPWIEERRKNNAALGTYGFIKQAQNLPYVGGEGGIADTIATGIGQLGTGVVSDTAGPVIQTAGMIGNKVFGPNDFSGRLEQVGKNLQASGEGFRQGIGDLGGDTKTLSDRAANIANMAQEYVTGTPGTFQGWGAAKPEDNWFVSIAKDLDQGTSMHYLKNEGMRTVGGMIPMILTSMVGGPAIAGLERITAPFVRKIAPQAAITLTEKLLASPLVSATLKKTGLSTVDDVSAALASAISEASIEASQSAAEIKNKTGDSDRALDVAGSVFVTNVVGLMGLGAAESLIAEHLIPAAAGRAMKTLPKDVQDNVYANWAKAGTQKASQFIFTVQKEATEEGFQTAEQKNPNAGILSNLYRGAFNPENDPEIAQARSAGRRFAGITNAGGLMVDAYKTGQDYSELMRASTNQDRQDFFGTVTQTAIEHVDEVARVQIDALQRQAQASGVPVDQAAIDTINQARDGWTQQIAEATRAAQDSAGNWANSIQSGSPQSFTQRAQFAFDARKLQELNQLMQAITPVDPASGSAVVPDYASRLSQATEYANAVRAANPEGQDRFSGLYGKAATAETGGGQLIASSGNISPELLQTIAGRSYSGSLVQSVNNQAQQIIRQFDMASRGDQNADPAFASLWKSLQDAGMQINPADISSLSKLSLSFDNQEGWKNGGNIGVNIFKSVQNAMANEQALRAQYTAEQSSLSFPEYVSQFIAGDVQTSLIHELGHLFGINDALRRSDGTVDPNGYDRVIKQWLNTFGNSNILGFDPVYQQVNQLLNNQEFVDDVRKVQSVEQSAISNRYRGYGYRQDQRGNQVFGGRAGERSFLPEGGTPTVAGQRNVLPETQGNVRDSVANEPVPEPTLVGPDGEPLESTGTDTGTTRSNADPTSIAELVNSGRQNRIRWERDFNTGEGRFMSDDYIEVRRNMALPEDQYPNARSEFGWRADALLKNGLLNPINVAGVDRSFVIFNGRPLFFVNVLGVTVPVIGTSGASKVGDSRNAKPMNYYPILNIDSDSPWNGAWFAKDMGSAKRPIQEGYGSPELRRAVSTINNTFNGLIPTEQSNDGLGQIFQYEKYIPDAVAINELTDQDFQKFYDVVGQLRDSLSWIPWMPDLNWGYKDVRRPIENQTDPTQFPLGTSVINALTNQIARNGQRDPVAAATEWEKVNKWNQYVKTRPSDPMQPIPNLPTITEDQKMPGYDRRNPETGKREWVLGERPRPEVPKIDPELLRSARAQIRQFKEEGGVLSDRSGLATTTTYANAFNQAVRTARQNRVDPMEIMSPDKKEKIVMLGGDITGANQVIVNIHGLPLGMVDEETGQKRQRTLADFVRTWMGAGGMGVKGYPPGTVSRAVQDAIDAAGAQGRLPTASDFRHIEGSPGYIRPNGEEDPSTNGKMPEDFYAYLTDLAEAGADAMNWYLDYGQFHLGLFNLMYGGKLSREEISALAIEMLAYFGRYGQQTPPADNMRIAAQVLETRLKLSSQVSPRQRFNGTLSGTGTEQRTVLDDILEDYEKAKIQQDNIVQDVHNKYAAMSEPDRKSVRDFFKLPPTKKSIDKNGLKTLLANLIKTTLTSVYPEQLSKEEVEARKKMDNPPSWPPYGMNGGIKNIGDWTNEQWGRWEQEGLRAQASQQPQVKILLDDYIKSFTDIRAVTGNLYNMYAVNPIIAEKGRTIPNAGQDQIISMLDFWLTGSAGIDTNTKLGNYGAAEREAIENIYTAFSVPDVWVFRGFGIRDTGKGAAGNVKASEFIMAILADLGPRLGVNPLQLQAMIWTGLRRKLVASTNFTKKEITIQTKSGPVTLLVSQKDVQSAGDLIDVLNVAAPKSGGRKGVGDILLDTLKQLSESKGTPDDAINWTPPKYVLPQFGSGVQLVSGKPATTIYSPSMESPRAFMDENTPAYQVEFGGKAYEGGALQPQNIAQRSLGVRAIEVQSPRIIMQVTPDQVRALRIDNTNQSALLRRPSDLELGIRQETPDETKALDQFKINGLDPRASVGSGNVGGAQIENTTILSALADKTKIWIPNLVRQGNGFVEITLTGQTPDYASRVGQWLAAQIGAKEAVVYQPNITNSTPSAQILADSILVQNPFPLNQWTLDEAKNKFSQTGAIVTPVFDQETNGMAILLSPTSGTTEELAQTLIWGSDSSGNKFVDNPNQLRGISAKISTHNADANVGLQPIQDQSAMQQNLADSFKSMETGRQNRAGGPVNQSEFIGEMTINQSAPFQMGSQISQMLGIKGTSGFKMDATAAVTAQLEWLEKVLDAQPKMNPFSQEFYVNGEPKVGYQSTYESELIKNMAGSHDIIVERLGVWEGKPEWNIRTVFPKEANRADIEAVASMLGYIGRQDGMGIFQWNSIRDGGQVWSGIADASSVVEQANAIEGEDAQSQFLEEYMANNDNPASYVLGANVIGVRLPESKGDFSGDVALREVRANMLEGDGMETDQTGRFMYAVSFDGPSSRPGWALNLASKFLGMNGVSVDDIFFGQATTDFIEASKSQTPPWGGADRYADMGSNATYGTRLVEWARAKGLENPDQIMATLGIDKIAEKSDRYNFTYGLDPDTGAKDYSLDPSVGLGDMRYKNQLATLTRRANNWMGPQAKEYTLADQSRDPLTGDPITGPRTGRANRAGGMPNVDTTANQRGYSEDFTSTQGNRQGITGEGTGTPDQGTAMEYRGGEGSGRQNRTANWLDPYKNPPPVPPAPGPMPTEFSFSQYGKEVYDAGNIPNNADYLYKQGIIGDPARPGGALEAAWISTNGLMRLSGIDPQASAEIRGELARRTGKTIKSYWYNNLLSGPAGAVTDIISNAINYPYQVVRTLGTAGVEAMLNIPADQRTANLEQVYGMTIAGGSAFLHAGKDALNAFINGMEPVRGEQPRGLWTGKMGLVPFVGEPINRLRVAADVMGYHFAEQAATYGIAYREAAKKGLKLGTTAFDQDVANTIAQIGVELANGQTGVSGSVTQIDQRTPGLAGEVTRMAKEAVFQEEGAHFALGLGGPKSEFMNFLVPFYRTLATIGYRGVDMMPGVGLATLAFDMARGSLNSGPYSAKERKAGQSIWTQQDAGRVFLPATQRVANQMIGTTIAGMGAVLVTMGWMTDSGPDDDKERQALIAEGWQPYSLVGTDANGKKTYRPVVNVLGPLAFPLIFGASAKGAWDRSGDPDYHALTAFASSMQDFIFTNSGLRAYKDAFDFMSGSNGVTSVKDATEKTIATFATGFIPSVSLLRAIANSTDPVIRTPTGMAVKVFNETSGWDKLASYLVEYGAMTIPGLSQQLAPKRNEIGQPVLRSPGKMGISAFLPLQKTVETNRGQGEYRYYFAKSALEDAKIVRAIKAYDEYRLDRTGRVPKPTPEQMVLVNQNWRQESPLYKQMKSAEDARKKTPAAFP